jgi:hypothetical protein
MVHYLKRLAASAFLLCASTQAEAQYFPGLGPWNNTVSAKTAGYAAITQDCGNTFSLGGGASYTLTINAPTTYPAQCIFVVVNTDASQLKTISFTSGPVLSFTLLPFQTLLVYNNNIGGPGWQFSLLPGEISQSWTPSLLFGGSSTGITFSSNFGSYTRIGPHVHADVSMTLSSKGAQAGAATITGLPLSVAVTSTGACYSGFWQNMSGITSALIAAISASASTIQLFNTGGTSTAALTNTNFTNTSQIFLVCDYFAS